MRTNLIEIRIEKHFAAVESDWLEAIPKHNGNLYLSATYQRALAGVRGSQHSYYAVFHRRGVPVGIGRFQLVQLDLGSMPVTRNNFLGWLGLRIFKLVCGVETRIVICGDPTVSGEHGFYFRPDIAEHARDGALAEAIRRVEILSGTRVSLIKDFRSKVPQGLVERGFLPVETAPTMVIEIPQSWRRLGDYLNDLSSKYRHRAKSVMKKSSRLERRELSHQDILDQADRMTALHENVRSKAMFAIGPRGVSHLAALRLALGDQFPVVGYLLHGELVGYFAAIVAAGRIDAYCVGFDYASNRENAIYPRMLFDHLQLAIDRGVKRVVLGRTAQDTKSALGAVPQGLTCLVQHRHPVINWIGQVLLRRMAKLDSPLLHNPFRHVEKSLPLSRPNNRDREKNPDSFTDNSDRWTFGSSIGP